jgi:hypothetical protein
MKRIAALILALCLVCSLVGCEKKTEKSTQTTTAAPEQEISMFDLSRAMLGAATFGEMRYISSTDDYAEDKFSYVSDLDYGKVEAFFLAYAADGKGNADEIAVIRVKDAQDVNAAMVSLQNHLQKRVALYQTYDPSQSEKLGKGSVFTDGRFAALIVSDDNHAVRSAFEAFLNK